MDDRWESEVIEYGAINITGFRIIDSSRRYVKDFLEGWRKLDPNTSQGAGRESISVGFPLSLIPHNKTYDSKFKFFQINFHIHIVAIYSYLSEQTSTSCQNSSKFHHKLTKDSVHNFVTCLLGTVSAHVRCSICIGRGVQQDPEEEAGYVSDKLPARSDFQQRQQRNGL